MEKEKDTILFIKATVAKRVIFNQKQIFYIQTAIDIAFC